MPGPSQISCPFFPAGFLAGFFWPPWLAYSFSYIPSLVKIVVIFNCSSINQIDGVVRRACVACYSSRKHERKLALNNAKKIHDCADYF